jgi:putative membrane protein
MNLKHLIAGIVLLLPLATSQAAGPPATGASPKPGETQDAGFIQKAGAGGLAEVELSRMAVGQAESPEVKRFAQQMLDAHISSNKELGLIAARQNQKLPAQMDNDHLKVRGRLESLSGKEFDRAYVDAMVKDHQKMASLLEGAKGTSSDSSVQKFARNTLPVVQEHLQLAESLAGKLR